MSFFFFQSLTKYPNYLPPLLFLPTKQSNVYFYFTTTLRRYDFAKNQFQANAVLHNLSDPPPPSPEIRATYLYNIGAFSHSTQGLLEK